MRSWLGRTCPPGSPGSVTDDEAGSDPERGRVTAHESAGARRPVPGPLHPQLRHPGHGGGLGLPLLATLRHRRCPATGAELVFFQHDEVVVHRPADEADAVAEAVNALRRARRPAALR